MKQLKCGDVMKGCTQVFSGYTENEVLRKVAEHGMEAHHIQSPSKDLEKKVLAAIIDVPDAGPLPTFTTHQP
jgi:predicted small metal-binding protein